MRRLAILCGSMLVVSGLATVPAFALCGTNKSCSTIPSATTGSGIAGIVAGSWNGDEYACSADGNKTILIRTTLAPGQPGRLFRWSVTPGSVTTTSHNLELRLVYPPTLPNVSFDAYLKVDAGSEVLLPDSLTTIGEIQVQPASFIAAASSSVPTGIPALGTTYRIVLAVSVLAGALWLIRRRA
jgi:hypothetical protein